MGEKPIYKKWWFWLLIIIIIIVILGNIPNNNSNLVDTHNCTNIYDENIIPLEVKSDDSLSFIDQFIENYNNISKNKITNIENFNVQDKNSNHYRVEFRLNSFNDSIGKTGLILDNLIDLIDYSDTYSKRIRIYATLYNNEILKDLLESSIHSLNIQVDSQDLEDIYNSNTGNFLIGPNDEVKVYIEKYEIMIDFNKHIN